jgi:hypothetical protein
MNAALSMTRIVDPEWLDVLSPDDPRALKSRRDLALINRVMMQAGIMARLLGCVDGSTQPLRFLEIGSGDGGFMLSVARRLARKVPEAEVLLLDRQNGVSVATMDAFAGLGWRAQTVETDVFQFLRASPEKFDAVSANLFLHHFEPEALAEMFALVAARTTLFAACEPRRDALGLAGSHMLWALGCNDVTRHDAVVSVRAGFAGDELSNLWPEGGGWSLGERRAGLFTHAFLATRPAETRP